MFKTMRKWWRRLRCEHEWGETQDWAIIGSDGYALHVWADRVPCQDCVKCGKWKKVGPSKERMYLS
jgi:hypothetical protein